MNIAGLEALRIKRAINTYGTLVEIIGELNSAGNPLKYKAFKFDYERDIGGQAQYDSDDPERDVTIFYFEADADADLVEGRRFRTVAGEIFVL